jgi:hypothetical protein
MNAVQSPVRPAMQWRRVVSRAAVCVIARQVVVSRRASLDVAAAEAEPEDMTVRTPASTSASPLTLDGHTTTFLA